MVIEDRLSVCVDCTLLIANGDGPDGHAAKIHEHIGDDCRWLVMACDESCDGWFSSGSCEACGSPLGGERHYAAVIVPGAEQ